MASKDQSGPIVIASRGCRFPGGACSPSALRWLLEGPRSVGMEISPHRISRPGYYPLDGTHHGAAYVQRSYPMRVDEDDKDAPRRFDAGFCGISPNEVDSMDP